MEAKTKKWLFAALIAVMAIAIVALTVVVCIKPISSGPNGPSGSITEGAETGVYYYDDGGQEYLITLNSGNKFTFLVMDANKSGEYALEGENLTLTFAKEEDSAISAKLKDNVLTLTYMDSQMRFLKKIPYTVTFDSAGGTSVEALSVVNGKTLDMPESPTREGYAFLGWYTDSEHTSPFLFGSQIVTSNLTLYAYWGATIPGQSEFTVNFDLNCDLPDPASRQTIGCRLYDLPTPEDRSGYEFGGWWISMYEDGEKLSYPYSENLLFRQNTTLYALWTSTENPAPKLETPVVRVDESSVSWDGIVGASAYRLEVTGPEGFTDIDKTVGTTTESIAFASLPAGDYVVKVTAIAASTDNNSQTTVRYYKNKALDRVSLFTVVEPSVLLFNEVANAERYLITIECGNDRHNHAPFELGNSTSYNFANCLMREGGIRFTVTAEADGWASSESRVFVYERRLSQVTGLTFDEETETLLWDAVPDAARYIVSIKCGDPTHDHEIVDNGNSTSYCLKECAPCEGGIVVNVYPETKGYNSPAASTYTYQKTALATPRDIRIEGTLLEWSAVTGAESYDISIGNTLLSSTSESLDLSEVINWLPDTDYQLTIRAKGSENSLWSDPIDIRYHSMYAALAYSDGFVSWRHVVGATGYEVKVNEGASVLVTDGMNRAEVALTRPGWNTISVRYFDGENDSEWASTEIYAHELTFDSRGGSAVSPQYPAIGDKVVLPTSTKDGYQFGGWYNTPLGPESNGALYEDDKFLESGELVLYAYWIPNEHTVTFDYGAGSGESATVTVVYGEGYTFTPPTSDDGRIAFRGYFSEPDGKGTQLTDDKGQSLEPWTIDRDVTVYAYWQDIVLSYTLLTDGTYSVTSGAGIDYVTEVTIPVEFEGIPVTVVDGYAFRSCYKLTEVNIPDTIKIIETGTAFDRCLNLCAVNIYEVEGTHEKFYESTDGVLIRLNTITGQKELSFFPLAKTGTYSIPEGVTAIPLKLFSGSGITKVVIPTTVTAIEQSAFYNCKKLTTVEFTPGGSAHLSINEGAFNLCTNLTEITIPARAEQFSLEVFKNCSSLKSIHAEEGGFYTSKDGLLCNEAGDTLVYCPEGREGELVIPVGITTVASEAFRNCDKLTKVSIPDFVTAIEDSAFQGCDVREIVFLGGSVGNATLIGNYAFQNCAKLTNITFEENSRVVSIGDYAFANCSSLNSFTIPAGMESVGAYAFANCTALKSVEFTSGSEELTFGDYAFRNCTGLSQVMLPSTVAELKLGVFDGCDNIAAIYVDEENPYYTDIEGVLYNKNQDGEVTELLFYPKGRSGDYVLPDTVTTIGASVFENNTRITKITIGENVTEIGRNAFRNCRNLAEIVFENGTAELSIGDYAFADCTALKSVAFPARVKTLGNYALYNASGITTVTLSDGIGAIGDYAFAATAISQIAIPESVETIGAYAFAYTGLTAVQIPASVSKIGDYAFAATSLATVAVPATVTDLGEYVFSGCTALTGAELPASLAVIPAGTFSGCSALGSIQIAASVMEIGDAAFENCFSLNQVAFNGNQALLIGANAFRNCTSLEQITLPDNTSALGEGAFYGCASLSSIALGDGLSSIGDSAFYGCVQLEQITLPEGLVSIGANAFFDCIALSQIDLPNTVNEIGAGAFSGCSALGTVTFEEGGTEALSIEADTFAGCTSLTVLPLPARVGEFDVSSIDRCTSLTAINVAEENEAYSSVDGILYDKAQATLLICPMNKSGAVTIPKTVTTVSNLAFDNRTGITKVTFEEGEGSAATLSIGTSAFRNCTSLAEVTLPERLTSLGNYAFAYCVIEEIYIPANVTTLGSQAFLDNEKLTELTFAEDIKLTTFGNNAFENCSSLTAVEIPASVTKTGNNLFKGASKLKDLTFAEGSKLTTIGTAAFSGTAIETFTVPAGVTAFGGNAFMDCTALSTVTLSQGFKNPSSGFYGYFLRCESLIAVNVPEGNAALSSVNGVVFNKAGNSLVYYPAGLSSEYVIPETVTDIGARAFQESGLTKITIHSGVTNIGNYAFSDCLSLSEVIFEENESANAALTLGNYVFQNCEMLTAVTLPERITKLGTYVFQNCTNLTEIDFGAESKLTSIGSNAFKNVGLVEIEIPASVSSLGIYAFTNSLALTTVTFGAGSKLTAISNNTFNGCTALREISLPESVTKVDTSAFKGCVSLKNIVLPDALSTLGSNAFQDSGLVSIVIPEKVTEIKNYAFDGCADLSSVTILGEVKNIGNYAFRGCTSLEEIDLPETATKLGDYSFQNSGLVGIEIPEGVTAIGKYAFAGSALEEITVPGSVESIGDYAFESCESLTSVELLTGVQEIGDYAFSGCLSLQTLSLSGSIESIGANAFMDCAGIASFGLAADNVSFVEEDGVLFNSDKTVLVSYATGKSGAYTVPDTVTEIAGGAFAGSGVTEVTIPNSVTLIGAGAFQGSAVSKVNLPNDLTEIADYTFADCKNLLEVELHSGIVTVGVGAFQGSGIQRITIPGSVTLIEDNAFDGCGALSELEFELGGNERLRFGEYAFQNCTSLVEITLPRRLRSESGTSKELLGVANYCFAGCTKLERVIFDTEGARELDDVLHFGEYVFQNCTSLTAIDFPDYVGDSNYKDRSGLKSLPAIGNYCFDGCVKLERVSFAESGAETFTFETYIFKGCGSLAEITLPRATTVITEGMFSGAGLKSFVLSENIVEIEANAFENCTTLSNLVIPGRITTIGANAFAGWTADQTISVRGSAPLDGWAADWNAGCAAKIEWNA